MPTRAKTVFLMKMQSVDTLLRKILNVAFILAPITFLFIGWRACKRADKQYDAKCKLERTMQFEGVVSNYKTDIFAEKSTFLLNDTTQIIIPRSSKEVGLHNGDTVTKVAGQNVYLVRWQNGWNGTKQETSRKFEFDCPFGD